MVNPANTQDSQLHVELYWCIQQLENSLCSGKLNKKQADNVEKSLKTLKNKTAPLVKKRQLMRTEFGDYRKKMQEEEKKLALASKEIKFTPVADITKKSNFVKKSAILSSTKDFKFNFSPEAEEELSSTTCSNDKAPVNNSIKFSSSEAPFKFNFVLDSQPEMDFDSLSIKN